MSDSRNQQLRALPAVDKLLSAPQAAPLIEAYGREMTLNALRRLLESFRVRILDGETVDVSSDALLAQLEEMLMAAARPTLRAVINATGVIIHTNLGRVLLSESAQRAVIEVAGQYNTLEYDLERGARGSRLIHAEALLCDVTGAEAALVVNNNAAATVLLLAELAYGREVIVSRGQLVEIGGGFRVPDIMAQSGAKLVEVGTTNRTRAADYARAITPETALLLRVHSSNFRQIGFTESTPLDEMAAVAHEHGLALVDDLGSGALLDTALFGLDHEPTVQESLLAGADVVAFSGDKLLGASQAGILVGRADLIGRLKRHPLARAMRADKLCLAALCATLEHYRRGDALSAIPVWRMISRPVSDIQRTAESWAARLREHGADASTLAGESTVGGGSLPGATLPTVLLALRVAQADRVSAHLRHAQTPIIARIADGQLLFDPRTVLPTQEDTLITSIVVSLET